MPASFPGRRDSSVVFGRDQFRQVATHPPLQLQTQDDYSRKHDRALLPTCAAFGTSVIAVPRHEFSSAGGEPNATRLPFETHICGSSQQHNPRNLIDGAWVPSGSFRKLLHISTEALPARRHRPGTVTAPQTDDSKIPSRCHNNNGDQRRIKTALAANGATYTDHEHAQ